jgi:D-glycero-alpha-D-manno-heptose-7-phosphate kinase
VLGKPIGKQDHYAAALGGFNFMEFLPGGAVHAEPLVCPPGTLERLHASTLLFYTGSQRSAGTILVDQQQAIRDGPAVAPLLAIRDLAYELRDTLAAGDVEAVGDVVHRSWELKRSLTPHISSPAINDLYKRGLRAGAAGGKLLGAGGGGFLLLIAPPERHAAVRRALDDVREVPMNFAWRGTRIVYLDRPSPG